MSFGTSTNIGITGEEYGSNIRNWFASPAINDGASGHPPLPNKDGSASIAMLEFINNDPEFAFSKICPPLYGPVQSMPRMTGLPGNDPDYIADFHFIGVMRSIDHILQPRYRGTIDGRYITPKIL